MTAPTPIRTDPPTQPLPIRGTEELPGRSWLMSDDSVIIIPAFPVGTWLLGEFVIRPYIALTDEARSDFALALIPAYFVIAAVLVLVFTRLISRGKDGRS